MVCFTEIMVFKRFIPPLRESQLNSPCGKFNNVYPLVSICAYPAAKAVSLSLIIIQEILSFAFQTPPGNGRRLGNSN